MTFQELYNRLNKIFERPDANELIFDIYDFCYEKYNHEFEWADEIPTEVLELLKTGEIQEALK